MGEPQVSIGPRGVERLHAGHLWVYRSDLGHIEAGPGDVVRVVDDRGRFHGKAFFSDRSQISLRLLTREDVPVDRGFLARRIRAAAAYRKDVVRDTEAFRLVYGEADLLPAIIVDRYADYLVLQTLCQSADRLRTQLAEILVEEFSPRGIIERNDPKVRILEGLEQRVSVVHGDVPAAVQASVNGVRFLFDLFHGQKTGGFLDQRENQQATLSYARGEVLDCFCYMGGFALTLASRCQHIEAVDMSPAALEFARRAQSLNGITNVTFREANAFDVLKAYDEVHHPFDMIILDPPAFAKNRDSIPAARRGYKEINLRALRLLKPGGYLVTSSCSHHVSEALFLQIVAEAANDAHKIITVVERRTQSRDHPILLTMPETHYIKFFVFNIIS
jgi:23S rRNA (cytosine1962-C5)-methyltransferase